MSRALPAIGVLLGTSAPRAEHMLLLLVGSSLMIKNYDLAIFGLAIPQIQESLAIPEESLGIYIGVMRMGVLAAFPLAFMADTVGRRRLLLFTIVGMTVATLLSAAAQSAWQYLALQSLARCFAYAEEMLCFVIVAEEIAAERRGWAFGWLAALGALGTGVAAAVYTAVNYLPYGWRGYYVASALGLAIIVLARQRLKETRRFEASRVARGAAAESLRSVLSPMATLVRDHPKRFWAMAAMTAPFAFGMEPALILVSKFLQHERHFSPEQVGMLYFLGGGIPVAGYLLAGPLSDRFGRRSLLAVSLLAAPALFALFYLATSVIAIVLLWVASMFLYLAADVTLSGLGSELFPTSCRATACAARVAVSILAGLAGLAAESALYHVLGDHLRSIVSLMAVAPLGVLVLWRAIPETAGRDLADIAPDMLPQAER